MSRRTSILDVAGQTREMKWRRGHPSYRIEVVWKDDDTDEDRVSSVTTYLHSWLDEDVRIRDRGDITNERVVEAVENILDEYGTGDIELRSFEVFEKETLRRSGTDSEVDN